MPEFTTDDGVGLYYEVFGSGPVGVFYLHCMGGNAAIWRKLWDKLADSRCRHVALDFRGHGGSRQEPCEMTNERLSRDALNLADALDLEKFIVVGHSMGGKVGMKLAALSPGRVLGLVLIGSPGPGFVPFRREDVAGFMATYHDITVTETFFRSWFTIWPNAEADAWIRAFAVLPDWALHAACEMAIWTNMAGEVGVLTAPALILAGEHDAIYGPSYQQQSVLPTLARARLVTISNCGHGLILEQPTEIAKHCAQFFSELIRTE